jgi:hypothetical protein
MIKQEYFKNEHVVTAEPEYNNITGACNGRAKVKLRCTNGLKSDAILKKLYQRGTKFNVTSRCK